MLVCIRLEGGQVNKQGTAGGDEGLERHCLGVGCVCQGTAGATEGGWIRSKEGAVTSIRALDPQPLAG